MLSGMPITQRESFDETFGMNLRILRERKGLSQSALAAEMTERGIPWHQQTIGRVEAGRQSVRFSEAKELAAILDTSTDRFTWESAEANATEFVYMAGGRLRQSYEAVAEAVCRLLADHDAADRVLAQREDSPYERVQEAIADVRARMEEYSADEAIEEGVRRYEELAGGEESNDDAEGEPADSGDEAAECPPLLPGEGNSEHGSREAGEPSS
jgi:transcriptional regulator with XRE-family HTH domain